MQVEVGKAPLFPRRYKIRRNYWVNLKGHKESHPVKRVIEECWEHGDKNIKSFGWVAKREAQVAGIADCEVSTTMILSSIPPWIFQVPKVDFHIKIQMKN